jgi:hypothetical protein
MAAKGDDADVFRKPFPGGIYKGVLVLSQDG